jgi:PKD repeat protein
MQNRRWMGSLACLAVALAIVAACDNESTPPATSPPPTLASPTATPAPAPTTRPANRAPVGDFRVSPTTGTVPLEVTFNSCRSTDPDGDTLQYSVNFGDGGSTSGRCLETHTYTAPGTYGTTIAVEDGRGGRDSQNVTVNVNSAPVPYTLGSLRLFGWANQVDVPGARTEVSLNNSDAFAPPTGYSYAFGDSQNGENRIEGRLRAAEGGGVWRFELGASRVFVPGSIRVESGTVDRITPQSITFRLDGRPGETVAFRFHTVR